MSADGSTKLLWGDEEYEFRLPMGAYEKIQALVNNNRVKMGAEPIGPTTLLGLLISGDAWPNEAWEVIYQGLKYAGRSDNEIRLLKTKHFDEFWPAKSYHIAAGILAECLFGPPGDPAGKPQAERAPAQMGTSPSPSPQFTVPVQH